MAPSADTSSSSEPSSKPAGRSKPQQVDAAPAPPLVLVANTWLDDLTARTRARPIPWEGYQRADLVSAEELKMIKKVDRQPKNKVDAVLDLVRSLPGAVLLAFLALLLTSGTSGAIVDDRATGRRILCDPLLTPARKAEQDRHPAANPRARGRHASGSR